MVESKGNSASNEKHSSSDDKLKSERLMEIKNSFLAVLSDEQNPIKKRGPGICLMSSQELDPYRLLGDEKVDCILRLLQNEGSKLGATQDLLLLAEKAMDTEASSRTPAQIAMSSFLTEYKELPPWVDKDQLKRGQEVFLAYAPVAGLSLYYRSLVPGFSSPKINAVIQSTGYLTPPSRPDQSLQRLFDTGELLSACMSLGIDNLMPDGIGWRTAIHVRILHAKVRHALLQRKGKRKWDIENYGIPINQEDLAATLLAFSVNVLVGIDLISGSSLSDREKVDYLALWRYIGWLLGVETQTETRLPGQPNVRKLPPLDPCGPPREDGASSSSSSSLSSSLSSSSSSCQGAIQRSYALLESMIFHLGDPDDTSVKIAHHLLQITDRKPPKEIKDVSKFYKNGLFYYRSLQCRKFIGQPLADALQLPFHPNRWKRSMIHMASGFAWFIFRVYTLASMYSPFCRRLIIGFHSTQFAKLHSYWIENHKSRMTEMLKHRPNLENQSNEKGIKESSMCPFAMIAPPSE